MENQTLKFMKTLTIEFDEAELFEMEETIENLRTGSMKIKDIIDIAIVQILIKRTLNN